MAKKDLSSFPDFVTDRGFFGEGVEFLIRDEFWISVVGGNSKQFSMEGV